MPRNVYHEINLHLVWHTRSSQPMIVPAIGERLYKFLHHRAVQAEGVLVHAINGTVDHTHAVVSVPPTLLISDWIGELKGSSSHHVNHEVAGAGALRWQTGYGVVSFGTKDLPWLVDYVRRQKEHHAAGRVFERLERIDQDEGERRAGA